MLHAKNGVRINSVNPGYVLTDVYGKSLCPLWVTTPKGIICKQCGNSKLWGCGPVLLTICNISPDLMACCHADKLFVSALIQPLCMVMQLSQQPVNPGCSDLMTTSERPCCCCHCSQISKPINRGAVGFI